MGMFYRGRIFPHKYYLCVSLRRVGWKPTVAAGGGLTILSPDVLVKLTPFVEWLDLQWHWPELFIVKLTRQSLNDLWPN